MNSIFWVMTNFSYSLKTFLDLKENPNIFLFLFQILRYLTYRCFYDFPIYVSLISFLCMSRQGLPSVCEFSAFRHFFITNVAQSVAELVLYSQKHEIWSFSIKFGELKI